jgi:transposase
MAKLYVVALKPGERQELERRVRAGRESARVLARARVLLKCDDGLTDEEAAEAVGVSVGTVERVRKRFCAGGLGQALPDRPQPPRPAKRKIDGEAEAKLVALACSAPPDGRESWTLELLADRMVKLKYVPGTVSGQTVRRVLKKRAEAVAERGVVHPAGAVGRVRLAHGRRAGRVPKALRPEEAGGRAGREAGATADRRSRAAAAQAGAGPAPGP